MENRVDLEKTFQRKLNEINNEIVQTLVTGKGGAYANKDLIEFKPGTLDTLNQLLAKRNGLLELMDQLCQK